MKRQWEIFVHEYAQHSDALRAYKAAYPKVKTDEVARVSASRLLKNIDIKTEIANTRELLVQRADEIAVKELKNERKRLFLSLADKREILYKIATGQKMPTLDSKGKRVWRYPEDKDRIRAIELDNEMTGEGFRPQMPEGGATINNGPVFNSVTRNIVFKTEKTTGKPQTFEISANE